MTTPQTKNQSKYYLKFLNEDRKPAYGGMGQWPVPGIWTEEIAPIPCKQGWHLCRKKDLFLWTAQTLWVAEAEDVITDTDKVVARRAKLVRQVEGWDGITSMLFGADCVEHVLHIFEEAHPNDDRPRKAIEVTRRFARGEADGDELIKAKLAAKNAARDIDDDEVWFAAWSAHCTHVVDITCNARDAAFDEEAEWDWQIKHLFREYLKLDPEEFH